MSKIDELIEKNLEEGFVDYKSTIEDISKQITQDAIKRYARGGTISKRKLYGIVGDMMPSIESTIKFNIVSMLEDLEYGLIQ